jgi:hypothetical protein
MVQAACACCTFPVRDQRPPATALAAAQIKGRERYDGFVDALGRRLARARKLADEERRDAAAVLPEAVESPGNGYFEFLPVTRASRRRASRINRKADIHQRLS